MNNDVGSIEYSARINTTQLKKDGQKADSIVQDVGGNMQKAGDKSANSFGKLGVQIGAVSGVVSSVMDTAITSVTNSIDGAIKRVDTLNNASRTFANMGFAVQDVDAVMKDLDASIKGLPTPIDAAVRGVQMLAGSTNDLDKSQEIFAALNNAILGFGGTANDVEGAILQISQAFAGGRVDAATWNSMLENNLGPALNAIAKDMGLTSASLKKGLSEGTISVEDFQDALIKMNKEGGGGLASFEKISKDATSGIGTGMANAQTAVTRGVAKIIEAIGSTNISNAISAVGKAFELLLNGISQVIGGATNLFNFIKDNSGVLSQVAIVIGTLLVPAIIKFGVQSSIAFGKYLLGLATSLAATIAASARMVVAWLLALGPIGLIGSAVVAVVALIITNWDTVSKYLTKFWEWLKSASSATWNWVSQKFTDAVNSIKSVFGTLTGFFRGVWDSIVSMFGKVGTRVGDAIGNTFKSVINSVLNSAAGIINGFIDAINVAVDVINEIPGVNISKLGRLNVPQLAAGGIITSPTLAMIGEGRESEAVIPLSKLDKMLDGDNGGNKGTVNVSINMSGIMTSSPSDERAVAKRIIERFNEEMRSKGMPEVGKA
jgi:tape measure domain-containing protein